MNHLVMAEEVVENNDAYNSKFYVQNSLLEMTSQILVQDLN